MIAGSAHSIIAGRATGRVLAAEQGLSFWGGVDPASARVIDAHHPWTGQDLRGRVLVMPSSRGSCSGSGVLLDLALNGRAPAALIFREAEDVLTLGALVAGTLFDRPIPVLRLDAAQFAAVSAAEHVEIDHDHLRIGSLAVPLHPPRHADLALTPRDRDMLSGAAGAGAQIAMQILCAMAAQQGAPDLMDVTQAHIDGCIYASPANLRFAQMMRDRGARVCIPTTMNAISVDHAHWRTQGVDPAFGAPAARLADAYVDMGARPTFTCAPYHLDTAPGLGEAVGWAESNAVIYANSVLGARTVKHPDFLDLCIAVTGRAPRSGVYLTENRAPARILRVERPAHADDAFWPMLGYLAGLHAPDVVPLITGLHDMPACADDLRAMCAAFGATSAAPMLHVAGHTPEADLPPRPDAVVRDLGRADFAQLWAQFNQAPERVDLIALGSPHFSITECRALTALLHGRRAEGVAVIVTLGRDVLRAARSEGLLDAFARFGIRVVPDLCWCSITEPVFPPSARVLMTNSGKYAHYAPGLSGRAVRFGGLAACVEAARTGRVAQGLPVWLNDWA
ncbi:MAG TPA: aconitase X [Paenirhodobacter sp.]